MSNLTVNNGGNAPKVTDAGLAHLSGLTKLTLLNVSGDFNGSGLKQLQGLQKLIVVEVFSWRELDAKAVEDLRRALPGAMKFTVEKVEAQAGQGAQMVRVAGAAGIRRR